MRALGAGLGLLALLVCIAIIMWLFSAVEIPKIKAGQAAKERVKPMMGYGKDDLPATDSFASTGQMKGSRLAALQVTSVTTGGAMDTFYGLKPGDEIVAIDGTPVDALSNNDEELAKAMVVSHGYQRQRPITVRRGSQLTELQFAERAPSPTVGGAPAPRQSDAPQGNPLQRQLQGIQDAAGQ